MVLFSDEINIMIKLSIFGLFTTLSVPLAAVDMVNAVPRVRVVQGDLASFTAQFAGGNGESVTFLANDASGHELGQVAVDEESGGLIWSFDSEGTLPGQHQVELVTMSDGSISDRKQFILDVVAATAKQQWRQNHFGSSQAGGVAEDDADPDHDGMVNKAEFALGLNPKKSGETVAGAEMDTSGESGGVVGMRAVFRRRKDHLEQGLRYTVEFSSNLRDWTPSSHLPQVLSDEGDIDRVGLSFPVLPDGTQSTFFRIRVEELNLN